MLVCQRTTKTRSQYQTEKIVRLFEWSHFHQLGWQFALGRSGFNVQKRRVLLANPSRRGEPTKNRRELGQNWEIRMRFSLLDHMACGVQIVKNWIRQQGQA